MQAGFDLLNNQSYTEAEAFFEKIIIKFPENKTAKICYARAVGLGGDPILAKKQFQELDELYSDDIEIKLNLAEANMWSKEYKAASVIYQWVLDRAPDNFTANLGMANAQSAQLKNVEALNYIKQALSIDPKNESAKTSKKYIYLALADRQRNSFNFKSSLKLLDSVLVLFPNDREAILNKAITYLWMDKPNSSAKEYQILLDKEIAVFDALMGLSYCATLLSNKKKALQYADEAIVYAEENSLAESIRTRANINKVNCIGIKGDLKSAFQSLEEYNKKSDDIRTFQLAKARLLVWDGKLEEGLLSYEKLNELYPEDFEILMGMADAHRALKSNTKAIQYIDEALLVQKSQPDALRLREELLSESNPFFTASGYKSTDIANNKNTGLTARFEFGSIDKLRSYVDLKLMTLSNEEPLQRAAQYILTYGAHYRFNSKIRINAQVQPTLATDNNDFRKTNLLFNMGIEYKLSKNNLFAYNFQQEAHNFNVDLLKSGIIMNHHKFSYSLNTRYKLGLYTQFILTPQSDKNTRRLMFASLYYNILTKPLLQTGINYTNIGFAEQKPSLYFSPKNYNAYEGFIKLNNFNSKRSKVLYNFMCAYGIQFTEDTEESNSLRIEADLGYKVIKRISLLAYYRYSSSASSTAVGFTWSSIGLRSSVVF